MSLEENMEYIDILNKLRRIKGIDAGGCGIATLAVLRWLKLNYPDELQNMSIVSVFDYDGKRLSEVKNRNKKLYMSKNKKGWGLVPIHVGLIYKNKLFFDPESHGISIPFFLKKEKVSRKQIQIFTNIDKGELFLLYIINTEIGDWNPKFNRKKKVPIIENKLKINLNDVTRI
jgi:hypothetical protein